MNNYFKIIIQLLLIWVLEMAVVWVFIEYLLPRFTEKMPESIHLEEGELSAK